MTNSTEAHQLKQGRAIGRLATSCWRGAQLKLVAEVVGEHRGQRVQLVGDTSSAGDVVERGVLLAVAENGLLAATAVEKGEHVGGAGALVGDDGLVLELAIDGLERVELQRDIVSNADLQIIRCPHNWGSGVKMPVTTSRAGPNSKSTSSPQFR